VKDVIALGLILSTTLALMGNPAWGWVLFVTILLRFY
jgi:hypothetical protein